MRFLKMVAALFCGLLCAYCAVIVGSTLSALYGPIGMAAVLPVALVSWLLIVQSLPQRQNETRYRGQGEQGLPVVRGSFDIDQRD